jgi:predicted nucleic-acid-binding Zn-ribbon protein
MASAQACPKCNCQMEQGFIVDMGHAVRLVSKWAPGVPRKAFLYKTKKPEYELPLGAFRCSSCGYVELYAGPNFAAK